MIVFIILLVVALPQTKLYAKTDVSQSGRQTLAYSLTPSDEDYSVEEVTASAGIQFDTQPTPFWKAGVISQDQFPADLFLNLN